MLKLKSVSTGYGGTKVIRGVSLAILDGEIVSLIGRNGVGSQHLRERSLAFNQSFLVWLCLMAMM